MSDNNLKDHPTLDSAHHSLSSSDLTTPNLNPQDPSRLSSHSASAQEIDSQVSYKEINHGDDLLPTNSILLLLLRPSTMELTGLHQKDEIVKVNYSKTKVQDVKLHISQTWRGKPKIEGIRLIALGKILNDVELVGETLAKEPGDTSTHPVHVVIRPNAWTEQLPVILAPPRSLSAPPIAAAEVGTHPQSDHTLPSVLPTSTTSSSHIPPSNNFMGTQPSQFSLSNFQNPPQSNTAPPVSPPLSSNSSYQLLWTHFSHLTRDQRAAFVDNLLKAQFCLVERLEVLRGRLYAHQVHLLGLQSSSKVGQLTTGHEQRAQSEDETWSVVDQNLTQLLVDLQYWGDFKDPSESAHLPGHQALHANFQQDAPSEFERVEISGLPFLLYIPEDFQRRSNQEGYLRDMSTLPPTAPIQAFQNMKSELDRTLHLDSRLHLLILQTKKLESSLNQLELLFSMTPGQTSGAGLSPMVRIPNGANGAGMVPNAGHDQLAFAPIRANAGPYNGMIQVQPNGNINIIGLGATNAPNANGLAPVAGAAGAAGLGFGPGLGNGLLPFPNNFVMPNGPMWQHPMARVRRYEFTINLDSIRRYMAPLLWLSLKLSFLLYIFGRHASFNKRAILLGMAIGWVLWEAFAISQRHEAQARRRERVQRLQQVGGQGAGGGVVDPFQAVLDRGRRRAERERLQQRLREQRQQQETDANQNSRATAPVRHSPARPATPLPPTERPPTNALADNLAPAAAPRRNIRRDLRSAAVDIRARGGAFPPGTEVRPFRTTSAFSPKYWFNSIAVVGLASEYRELGLHPIGERTMGSSNSEYPSWYKYLRNFKTCVILFFGTLLPEIEKKRRKALEKRSRILNLVIADAARERENGTNDVQPDRGVEELTTDNNRLSGSDSAQRTTPPEADGSQITPKVLTATGLELSSNAAQQTLISRHPRQSTESNEDTADQSFNQNATPRASTSASNVFNHRDNLGSTSTSTSTPGQSSVPPALIIPTISHQEYPSGAEASSNEATGATNPPSGDLDSPLTPLNERHVVGGLDDTDDEEIMGAGEDEAGMMLF